MNTSVKRLRVLIDVKLLRILSTNLQGGALVRGIFGPSLGVLKPTEREYGSDKVGGSFFFL